MAGMLVKLVPRGTTERTCSPPAGWWPQSIESDAMAGGLGGQEGMGKSHNGIDFILSQAVAILRPGGIMQAAGTFQILIRG